MNETKKTLLAKNLNKRTIQGELQLLRYMIQHRVERRGQDDFYPPTGSSTKCHDYDGRPWDLFDQNQVRTGGQLSKT